MKSIALKQWEAAAYAAGRLTQIRRVVKHAIYHRPILANDGNWYDADCINAGRLLKCPYGAPGDTLALREAWCHKGDDCGNMVDGYWYKADTDRPEILCFDGDGFTLFRKDGIAASPWKPSSKMPLSAVRWHPVITAVRLERVQEMTEGDAVACGKMYAGHGDDWQRHDSYRVQFDRYNPRTPWESDPWTWVYDVEGVKA